MYECLFGVHKTMCYSLLKFRQGKFIILQFCLQLVLWPMTDISTDKGQITFYIEQEYDCYIQFHPIRNFTTVYSCLETFKRKF